MGTILVFFLIIGFVISLTMRIREYLSIENFIIDNQSIGKDYKTIRKEFNNKYKALFYIDVALICLVIIVGIITAKYLLEAITWMACTCGGVAYDEAGDPGGPTGREAYKTAIKLGFTYLPIALWGLVNIKMIFSIYKYRIMERDLKIEIDNKVKIEENEEHNQKNKEDEQNEKNI